ncbi:MAG: transcription/translation regulatory transformer protein RfaH [Aliivibrio sp.]|uniref:transcription/translation regulatory transformer protein RfaH n=1 Tax=Aliivibrio sp. TaxID=1872443 RepID=UPI001A4A64C8|nr:transcription/translation regulatory transformer protein RfaH [Aliivibrio sp.]
MKFWYLLYCKRGDQRRAVLHLENQGVECYFPEIEVNKLIRGKKSCVKEPLFPCYVFIHFDVDFGPSFTTVRSTRGVSDFVRIGPLPRVIEAQLIVSLKQIEQLKEQEETLDLLPTEGQEVLIKSGPYANVEAVYKEADGEVRSILLIKLISQKVEVVVENKNIEFDK